MPKIFPAVKAVIMDRGKFLAVRHEFRGKSMWDLPGGRVNYGESPIDALHREVKEEVGLDIMIIRPLGVWWFFKEEAGEQVVCTTFLCKPRNRKLNIGSGDSGGSITETWWVSKGEFLSEKFPSFHGSLKRLISDL